MSQSWDSEAERFLTLRDEDRWKWFARLLYELTMLARSTYAVGGNSLNEPERMRRFNELFHRIASQQRDDIDGIAGRPDAVFMRLLAKELTALEVDVHSLVEALRN